MKKILFTRHAKSSWASAGLSDHDRPLNDRGLSSAKMLGKEMKSEFDKVDEVYVSSAKRAQETAKHLKLDKVKMYTFKELYTFDFRSLISFITSLKTNADYIQIVGHNPAITEIINHLSTARIDNVPTAGMAILKWEDANSWEEIEDSLAKLMFYNTPKRYL